MKLFLGVNCHFCDALRSRMFHRRKNKSAVNFLERKFQNIYSRVSHKYVANQIDFDKLLHILLLLLCIEKCALCGEKLKQYDIFLETKRGANVRRMKEEREATYYF